VTDVETEEGELTASFDGRSVTYGFGELDALVPAYAASIHKSHEMVFSRRCALRVLRRYPYLSLAHRFIRASLWTC
jgi:exodeoxyribonuclease V alpha subunit